MVACWIYLRPGSWCPRQVNARSNLRNLMLGILSLWPAAYLVLLAFMFNQIRTSASRTTLLPLGGLALVHVGTLLLIIFLMGFYIRHVNKSNFIRADKKTLWKAFVVLGNIVAFPVCWFFTVWQRRHESGE